MKIRSGSSGGENTLPVIDIPTGGSAYTLTLDDEQLELIAAYLMNTRLGVGVHKSAAYKLLQDLESAFGTDGFEQLSDAVNLGVTIEDGKSQVLLSVTRKTHDITLEV